jgi:hypothetical protein
MGSLGLLEGRSTSEDLQADVARSQGTHGNTVSFRTMAEFKLRFARVAEAVWAVHHTEGASPYTRTARLTGEAFQ